MNYQIYDIDQENYLKLIEIWEKSVRATHDFLPDEAIRKLKPLILNKYFNAVLLKGVKDVSGEIRVLSKP